MKPRQYEELVAKYYQDKGYRIILTPYTNDSGVDIIAEKGEERIAIQAKMYGHTNRKINRNMVFQLKGAMSNSDCNQAVLVTDGQLLSEAEKAAIKIGISIVYLKAKDKFTGKAGPSYKLDSIEGSEMESKKLDDQVSFENIWGKYVIPLAGKEINTQTGSLNKIVRVDWGGIERITKNGNKGKIPIEPFQYAINMMIEGEKLYREEINQKFEGRYSSGVFAILISIPLIRKSTSNPIYLYIK